MLTHTTLEMSSIIKIVLRSGFRHFKWTFQPGASLDQRQGFLKVFVHISPKVQDAAWLEGSLDLVQEYLVHDASLAMSLLPPGIGKIDVDGCERRVGYLFRDQQHRVAVDQPSVL